MSGKRSVKITKIFRFEMSHSLEGHEGDCKNLHGHSYQLQVTLKGVPLDQPGHTSDGMVMDFSHLKKIVKTQILDRFDHALVLNQSTPEHIIASLTGHYPKLIIMPFQPTCENLLLHFVDLIVPFIPPYVTLHSVRLDETATSFAEVEL